VKGWFAPSLALVLSACTVGVENRETGTTSGISCTNYTDCGSKMTCQSGICQATPAISSVLMAVAFPESENLANYSATSFVLSLDIPATGQANIALPALQSLTINTSFEQVGDRGLNCDYAREGDASRTVQAVVSHRWPVEGLEQNLPRSATDLPATFTALPVASNYEVYLALSNPFQDSVSAQNSGCALPPVLLRDVAVGDVSSLTLNWPGPKTIAVDVQVSPMLATAATTVTDLQGWQLDIVDPIEGRELAVPVTLGSPVVDATDSKINHYHAKVAYNPIASRLSPPVGTEILRLQPKAGSIAPTFYAAISNLTLFNDSTGETAFKLDGVPETAVLTGRVESEDKSQPLSAEIAFNAISFSIANDGIGSQFSTFVQSDDAGQFEVALPSGKYQVVAVPPNDQLHGSLETTWTVQGLASTQGGRLLSIPMLSHLVGGVDSSVRWSSSSSATLQATPSSRIVYDATTNTAALRAYNSGASTASALFQPAQTQLFDLPTDSGTFDISLRPPDGLPWIVTPGVAVGDASTAIQRWTMPLPVSWSGRLRVPLATSADSSNLSDLPRAVLRVFVLLDKTDPDQATQATKDAASIVQIAETRAGADGSFNLVLPDQLQRQ
jgi:hypothetical protein